MVDEQFETKSLVVTRKERPNEYEFGKSGNRVNLAFSDAQDLARQIKELKDIGVFPETQ